MDITVRQPLFLVTGASCAGKTTTCNVLFQREKDYIVLESDVLWNDFFNTPQDDYRLYRSMWMNMCAHISQIGLPCVLCGCCTPQQFERLPERNLFTDVHYLAVVCNAETLRDRMTRGRKVTDPAWIESSVQFNDWLLRNCGKTNPPMEMLDTTDMTPEQAADALDRWIRERL